MHTGLQHGDPHQHACQQVGSDSGDAEAIESDQAADPERGGQQRGRAQRIRVKAGDDDQSAEVVEYGEGRQKHDQRPGRPLAEQGEQRQREHDIGGCRNGPALRRPGIAGGDQQVDRHWHYHAADGRGRR